MKNNRGFTLTELLAVIVLLSILMLIAVPNIQGALGASKNSIGEYEKKAIKDAAERAVLEVLNCDLYDSTYNVFGKANTTTCSTMQNYIIGNTVNSTVELLKNNGYFDDKANRCSGNITITTDNAYKITVDTSNVTCG